jgi:hypothetical protein
MNKSDGAFDQRHEMNKRLSLEIRMKQRGQTIGSPAVSKMARQTTIPFPSLFNSPSSNPTREVERRLYLEALKAARSSCGTSSDSNEQECPGRRESTKGNRDKSGAIPPFAALFEIGDRSLSTMKNRSCGEEE